MNRTTRGSGNVISAGVAAVLGAFALLLMPGSITPSEAQEFNDVQLIINPRLTFERMRRVRTGVRDAVGKRLAPGPAGGTISGVVVEPSGLRVTPTAADAAADPKWNAWVDGTYTDLDEDNALRAYDGSQTVVMAATDHRLTDRLLLGGLFVYSDSDVDNVILPGGSETESHGVGGYMGYVLTDNLVFDASFLYSWIDNSADSAGVTADYDGESWNLNANLTGYWYAGNLRLSPGVGISYSRTRDDAYVDSTIAPTLFPSQVTRTGSLTFGMTFGYTIALDDTRTAEPYVSIEGEWEFEESTSPSLSTATVPTDSRDFDAKISTGIEIALATNMSLTLKGDFGGLARKRYRTLAGGGQFAVQF